MHRQTNKNGIQGESLRHRPLKSGSRLANALTSMKQRGTRQVEIGDQRIDRFEFEAGQNEQAGGPAAGPNYFAGNCAASGSFQGAHAGGAHGNDPPAF